MESGRTVDAKYITGVAARGPRLISRRSAAILTLEGCAMKTLLALVAWLLLFVVCWPLALLALVLWPFVWLLSLPFRLVGLTFEALFALLRAMLFLPARMLGYRGSR
jgi:hypothetical protein